MPEGLPDLKVFVYILGKTGSTHAILAELYRYNHTFVVSRRDFYMSTANVILNTTNNDFLFVNKHKPTYDICMKRIVPLYVCVTKK